MTKKEFKKIIEEVEVLIECNKVMINRIYNDADLDVSDIIALLESNTSWLEFNLDCLKTGAELKKVF